MLSWEAAGFGPVWLLSAARPCLLLKGPESQAYPVGRFAELLGFRYSRLGALVGHLHHLCTEGRMWFARASRRKLAFFQRVDSRGGRRVSPRSWESPRYPGGALARRRSVCLSAGGRQRWGAHSAGRGTRALAHSETPLGTACSAAYPLICGRPLNVKQFADPFVRVLFAVMSWRRISCWPQ